MLIVEPDVESQRVCPPPPHKKLKYEGLTTEETINLNPKHHVQDEVVEEDSPKRKKSNEEDEEEDDDSPKRKKSASSRDSRDLYKDVQRKLNF